MKLSSLSCIAMLFAGLLFVFTAQAALLDKSTTKTECEYASDNFPGNSCSVELESTRCYAGTGQECYIATHYDNGSKKATYEVDVVAVEYSNGTTGYWISYTDKFLHKTYQISDTFDSKGKAISNWVKTVIGDCSYSFK